MTNQKKLLILHITLVFLSITNLSACFYNDEFIKTDWEFIVPNNYQGFLVIDYGCDGGIDLQKQIPNIKIMFKNDGTFCSSSDNFAWNGKYLVKDRSGHSIDTEFDNNFKGYGLYSDGTRTIHGNKSRTFSIFWLGDLTSFQNYKRSSNYDEDLRIFFLREFGLDIT